MGETQEISSTTEFARGSNCGLISAAAPLVFNNSGLIISLAARHRLPAVYPYRSFVADGGLISYGPTRSIRAGKPLATSIASLRARSPPTCQCRTKFELVINLKTAKALGLNVPSSLLSRANEIIK